MIAPNPITHEGELYDQLGVTLAISPSFGPNSVGISVNLVLTPYRKDPVTGEHIVLYSHSKSHLFGNIKDSTDMDALKAFSVIQPAVEKFILAKEVGQ